MKRRKKHFSWALYENLCRIERDEAFRLLKWAVDLLEMLKPAKKVGADATGMRQSKRDCAWSSASLDGRGEYTKTHGLFNLETGTVEAFEATKELSTNANTCQISSHP
jgi:hypothetical protein